MTTYEVTWLGGQASLDSSDRVDGVLGPLHEAGQPIVVDIFRYEDGKPAGGVQVGLGHPDRSFVLYFGHPEGGYAIEPGIPLWDGDIEFAYGGQLTEYHPAETRITPDRSFTIIRELIATDQRPTSVDWDQDTPAHTEDPDTEWTTADDPWS